jgi:integrase
MKGSVRCLRCRKGLDACDCGDSSKELRVYAGIDPATKRKRWVSRTVRGSKRAARLALAELVTEVSKGRHRATEGTLSHLLDRWLEQGERLGRSPATLRTYRSYINANIVPALGHIELRKLSPADLDGFYRKLDSAGRRRSTIHQHHSIISAALNQARKWRWVSENVAELASPPTVRQEDVVAPTLDEVRRLLVAAEERSPDVATLLWVAATTGARRGELCALRWSDVDLERRSMTIARSVVDVPGGVTVKDTKTHRTRRVAIDDATLAVLLTQRRRQEVQLSRPLAADAYVFSQALDATVPYRPDRVTGSFRRLRQELQLEHVNLHHLRHFMATRAIRGGVDLRTVAGRLGHANGSITMKVYAHFLEEGDREAADVMGELLG